MTKHKKSRKAQMGGLFGWGEENQSMYSQNQYGQKKPWYDVSSWFSNSNQSSSSNPSSSYSSSSYPSSSYLSSSYPSSYGQPTGQQQPLYSNQPSGNIGMGWGGKGKRRTVRMNGGKMSGLNAAPVGGLKVARPTYFLKNGGKKQKTQRRRKH
jgi:hypothetical protein